MALFQPQGFLAVPPSGQGPGVLVLHAWWGLNDTIKAFCTRLAESGFVAFAPDLYHGKVADNIADAEALGQSSRLQLPPGQGRDRGCSPVSQRTVLDRPAAAWR